jgi:hypothetical protein
MPLGPSEVLSRLATVRAAMMLIWGCKPAVRTYLVGFETLGALLFLLLAEDDEGTSVFVKCKTHFCAK